MYHGLTIGAFLGLLCGLSPMRQVRRNPDTATVLLVGLGLLLLLRSRGARLFGASSSPAPLLPPSYSGWPSVFPQMATEGAACTTSNGQPGTWHRVEFGAVQVGGIPQQWICWPRGVPITV
jgi:hypothetical protein